MTDNITSIAYIILLIWGVGTTLYGLYLSRKNNEHYNSKIVSELKLSREILEEIYLDMEEIKNGRKDN